MSDILSLWRLPLDKVALREAQALFDRQPRCTSIGYGEDFSQMTVYNFGYYVENYSPLETALGQMFEAIATGEYTSTGGGLAFIPQQSFPVVADSFYVPDQCVMVGSGGGGLSGSEGEPSFYHFVVTPFSSEEPSTFLECTANNPTSGGIYLRSLAFQWGMTAQAGDTCIHAAVPNCRVINCTFTDCPRAFNAVSLGCGMEQCTINYTVPSTQGPNGATAVTLSGPQGSVVGPGQFSQLSQASGGATGCTCIAVNGPAEHVIVADMQIYEWAFGIDFSQSPGSISTQIRNCEIVCWQTALNILLPANAGGSITTNIKVTSCTLTKASDSTDGNPIVKIDAAVAAGYNTNGQLNDITLTDCSVYSLSTNPPTAQYGLEIVSGQNIKIIGGTYSNNTGAGIAITGAVGDVQIIGANLQPNYPGAPNTYSQLYGLLVQGSPAGRILVTGCDMAGYRTPGSAVAVIGGVHELLITNCVGYNDQNTALVATSAQLTSGIGAAGLSNPYYGPSVFVFTNAMPLQVKVFGQTLAMSFGIIYLPSPYDSIQFLPAAPTSFSWTGR